MTKINFGDFISWISKEKIPENFRELENRLETNMGFNLGYIFDKDGELSSVRVFGQNKFQATRYSPYQRVANAIAKQHKVSFRNFSNGYETTVFPLNYETLIDSIKNIIDAQTRLNGAISEKESELYGLTKPEKFLKD